MAYIVMAYMIMAYIVMAYVVMAHIVMAHRWHWVGVCLLSFVDEMDRHGSALEDREVHAYRYGDEHGDREREDPADAEPTSLPCFGACRRRTAEGPRRDPTGQASAEAPTTMAGAV